MTVPYTFANQAGPVPASELDANFAAVGNNVSTANTVLAHAQPNITSVGILTVVSTSGNVVATGNVTANNITINTIVEPVVTNDLNVTGQVFINWLDANGNALPGAGIVASTANIYDIGESSAPFANVYATNYFGAGITATGFSQLPTYTIANLRTVTGNVGHVASVTDSNPIGALAFWNGTGNVWSYVANSTPV